jgi:hypothetical protein
MQIPVRTRLERDTTSVISVSHLDLTVNKVITRLLVQHRVAPSVDGAWLKEVHASFEFDRELFLSSLKQTVSKSNYGNSWEKIYFFLI